MSYSKNQENLNTTGTSEIIISSTPLPLSGGIMTGNITTATGYGIVTSSGLIAGSLISLRRLTSGTNATYTPTAGTRLIFVEMCGGGGGSGGAATCAAGECSAGSPGGASPTLFALINVTTATGTYSIGAGGSGGTPTANGTAGGNTTFSIGDAALTVPGGFQGMSDTIPGSSSSSQTFARTSGWSATGSDIVSWFASAGAGAIVSATVSTISTSTLYFVSGKRFNQSALAKKYYASGNVLVSESFVRTTGFTVFAETPLDSPGTGALPAMSAANASQNGAAGTAGAIFVWEYA